MWGLSIVAVGQTISRMQRIWQGRPTNSVTEASDGDLSSVIIDSLLLMYDPRLFTFSSYANLDPNAKFDGSHPDYTHYEEPPAEFLLLFVCLGRPPLVWLDIPPFSVYLL
jgi:hypothetical protein